MTWFANLLNSGGYLLGYLVIMFLGMLFGVVGHFFAKIFLDAKSREDNFGVLMFAVFYALLLMLTFGIIVEDSLQADFSEWSMFFRMIGLFVFCFLLSTVLLNNKSEWSLHKKNTLQKMRLISISCGIFSFIMVSFFLPEIAMVQLSKENRARWFIVDKTLTLGHQSDASEKIKALKKIERYGASPEPFYTGLVHLYIAQPDFIGTRIAAEHFRALAKKDETSKDYWNGIAAFYRDDFKTAADSFKSANAIELEIISLALGKKLTESALERLPAKLQLLNESERIILKRLTRIGIRPPQTASKESVSIADPVMKKLLEIERAVVKLNPSLFAQIPSPPADERDTVIRVKSRDFRMHVFSHLTLNPPKIEQPKLYWWNVIFFPSAVALFLVMLFGTNAIIRDRKEFLPNVRKQLGDSWNDFQTFLGRVSWHSALARKLAQSLITMEPEHGFFSVEIKHIHHAVFPFDVLAALLAVRRAKQLQRDWKLDEQEKNDIHAIVSKIATMGAEIIPHGDENVLEVVTTMRQQSKAIKKAFLKKEKSYLETRDELIAKFEELLLVRDIVSVPRSRLSYYDFLGVDPTVDKSELKKAWRKIALAVHPDQHQDDPHLSRLMRHINEAYQALSLPSARQLYDREMGFSQRRSS